MAYAIFLKTPNTENPPKSTVPRCASPKIALSNSLAVWLTPKQYYCEDCGYLGIIVMELDEETKDEKEET